MKRGSAATETPEMLLERFKETGDADAIGTLFDDLAPGLLRVALAICPDVAQAEDVLQETFLAALAAADRFEAGRPVRPWLAGILRNMAKRAGRERSRRPDPARLATSPSPHGVERANPEERQRLREAIDALDEPYRSVALLHYVHGLPPAEIAHLRDEPPGTVRSSLHRARRLLHGVLISIPALALLAIARDGLAAVREVVVTRAAAQAASATLFTLGGVVLMKKAVVGAAGAVALLLLGTWLALSLWDEEGDATQAVVPMARSDGTDPALAGRTGKKEVPSSAALVARAGHVVGEVRDAQGRPIVGARIVAVSEATRDAVAPAQANSSASSRADGGFDIELGERAPAFVLYAEAPGFAPLAVRGIRDGARTDFELQSGARLTGRVLDPEDAPVSGARVAVLAIVDSIQVARRATTDAQGRYDIGDLVPSGAPRSDSMAVMAWVLVEAEGFAPLMTKLRLHDAQAFADPHDLYPVRGSIVQGRVVDAESGAPLPGAEVVLASTEGMMGMGWGRDRTTMSPFGRRLLGVTRSDEQGGYRFEHVPARGRHPGVSSNSDGRGGRALGRVGAILAGYASATETVSFVADGKEQAFELRLWPAARVRGRVVDGKGRALEGLGVSCSNAERKAWGVHIPGAYEDVPSAHDATDADGRFELTAVPALRAGPAPAVLQLRGPRGPRRRERAEPIDVMLAAGKTLDLGDIVYSPETRILVARVRVLDPAGAPVWDAMLGYQPERCSARTDREGWAELGFRAPRITERDTAEMFVFAENYAVARFFLRFEEGEDQVVHLTAGASVRGTVRDADGGPIDRAWVEATPALRSLDETYAPKTGLPRMPDSRPLPVFARASTDSEGAFTLPHLPAGRYHLLARAQQPRAGRWKSVFARAANVESGASDVALVVPRPPGGGATVEVHIRDEHEASVGPSTASLAGSSGGRRVAPGHFRFVEVPSGTRTLTVLGEGYVKQWHDVVVKPGVNEPVVVVLKKGARVAGTVVGVDPTIRLEGLRISFYRHGVSERRPEGATALVGAAGKIEVSGLHAGSYRVQLAPPSFSPKKIEVYVLEDNQRVDIPDGTSEVSLDLRVVGAGILKTWPEDKRLPPRPGSGKKATKAQDEFARGAALEVRDAGARLLLRVDAIRDEWGGSAGYLPLAPGTYTIELQLPGDERVRRTAEVRAGEATEAPLRAGR